MFNLATADWHQQLQLARDLPTPGERSSFYSAVRRGEFVQVCRGAYVRASLWRSLDKDARHRAMVKAVAAISGTELTFSHSSAAALWRLPRVGPWPQRAHVLDAHASGGRSTAALVRHSVGIPVDLERIDGLVVTSLARTVVDVARCERFGSAVAAVDAALRRTVHPLEGLPTTTLTPAVLREELAGVPMRHGSARAARVVEFANGAADRPGESMSRVSMHLAGITMPLLQVELFGASGKRYIVDFWWPEFNVIGEFDGKDKYSNPVFLRGRTPEQALLDEKDREDDLRAAGHGMSRWRWSVAIRPRRLRDHLALAGVR